VASVLVFVPQIGLSRIAIASELRDFNLGTAAAYGVVLMLDDWINHDGGHAPRTITSVKEWSDRL